jgi:superfamily I DNA and/or RNA helicase
MVLLKEYKRLNSGQKEAVKRVISSLDYTLLLGMPGTGKTSTLSFVIRTLVARGQRILITSYTNAAVDNLMNKLVESGVSAAVMGRLGSAESSDVSLEGYVVDTRSCNMTTVRELTGRVEGFRIIGATVLTAARSGLLQKLAPFDWCVMDEAGQISQPAALGGMLLATKHLLVGDDYQLPPLVVSLEAQVKGMEVSMFKRLGEAHPNSVVRLTAQYRMNADIMTVCNTLIYEHQLQCGSQVVANGCLCYRNSLEMIESLSTLHKSWLYRCLEPQNSVVFVNTDTIRGTESSSSNNNSRSAVLSDQFDGREMEYKGDTYSNSLRQEPMSVANSEKKDGIKKGSLHNPTEIAVISLLVEAFAVCGLDNIDSAIGIISPYRAQVRSIQTALFELNTGNFGTGSTALDPNCLEILAKQGVSTIDKYQGRDMGVIILSLVRSNDQGMVRKSNLWYILKCNPQ